MDTKTFKGHMLFIYDDVSPGRRRPWLISNKPRSGQADALFLDILGNWNQHKWWFGSALSATVFIDTLTLDARADTADVDADKDAEGAW